MKSVETKSTLRQLFGGEAPQVTLSEAIETFLSKEMRGKSDETKTWYRRRLGLLSAFLVKRYGRDPLLLDLLEADLDAWYQELDERDRRWVGSKRRPEAEGGLSVYTKHSYIRAAKRLFAWLHRRLEDYPDLGANLQLPSLPKRGRKGVSDQHAKAILAAARNNQSPIMAARDYALIYFLEATGARRGGAANLRLSDLNLDAADARIQRRVTVFEKGDEERTVFLTPDALEALLAWLRVRPNIKDNHVFLGQRPGEAWKPLSRLGIGEVLNRYKRRLGIEGRVSPHQWRHRWFRTLLHKGMGLKKASQMGGHKGVVVTADFYSDFDVDELQEFYDRYSSGLDMGGLPDQHE